MNHSDFASSLLNAIRRANRVVVFTGAGISAESGIPTYRDALTGALWKNEDPRDLATPEGFARDPVKITRWYDERRIRCLQAQPNLGHKAVVQLEKLVRAKGQDAQFTLITQNVDRLHQRAGSTDVVELHGSLYEWRCTRTGKSDLYESPEPFDSYPPKSPHSESGGGAVLRPGVVWFGESLPTHAVTRADLAVADCDLFFTIGTSGEVYPAAGYIDKAIDLLTATTIEINPEPTLFTGAVDYAFQQKAGELLPKLIAAL